MYYELYVDSLFLVNFVMNLYLLLLVNQSLFRTATRRRLVLGAAIGALFYFLPFLLDGPIWLRFLLGIPPGGILMIIVAFRIRSVRVFFRVLEGVLMYSILLGGAMLLIRRIPWFEERMMGIWGVLGIGAILYLVIGYLIDRKIHKNNLCNVTLIREETGITVTALLDSGNGLMEPISGKPVSIVEKETLIRLWGEEPPYFRAIPYHSIGKKRGILKGYLLPEMQIEMDGVIKICRNTYIAVCEEYIASGENDGRHHVTMILNPSLLDDKEIKSTQEEKKKEGRVG